MADPGVCKIHYISLRVPFGPHNEWTTRLLKLSHHAHAFAQLYDLDSTVAMDPTNYEYVWTVGVPEGMNASKIYTEKMQPVGDVMKVEK